MKKFFIFIFVLLLILSALVYFYVLPQINDDYKGYSGSLLLDIPRGSSVNAISEMLESKGIIKNRYYFLIYYKIFSSDLKLKSGEYLFDKPLSLIKVIDKLYKGKVFLHKITIKEGLTIKETAQELAKSNFNPQKIIELCKNTDLIKDIDKEADDLEGYLFPETYMYSKGTDEKKIIKMMVDRFKSEIGNDYMWRAQEMKMSVREVVTLASLIEKESSLRSERFLISSVFHNRLEKKMSLGCDPTIIYALERDGIYNGSLGWKDLKYDSPYNTRVYQGLPPGPIASPGKASIEAALYPESSDYLYFVAKDGNSHYFSQTLSEHNRAVKKFIIDKE